MKTRTARPVSVAPLPSGAIPLPDAIIPYLIDHLDHFEATFDGEAIILRFKDRVSKVRTPPPTTNGNGHGLMPPITLKKRLVYQVVDRKRSPEIAQKFGFSEPRLRVYQAVYDAPQGATYKELKERTGMQHGSISQILHWLQKQGMIVGEQDTPR